MYQEIQFKNEIQVNKFCQHGIMQVKETAFNKPDKGYSVDNQKAKKKYESLGNKI